MASIMSSTLPARRRMIRVVRPLCVIPMKRTFLSGLLFLIVCSSSPADPAAPYEHDCLKSIDQWRVVTGKWAIQENVLRGEPSQSPKQLLFQEQGFEQPKWYSLRLTAAGLSHAQEQEIGIILGYTDPKNYYLCTFTQLSERLARVSLCRIRDGHDEHTSSVHFDHPAEDSVSIALEVYAQGQFRTRVCVGTHDCLTYEDATSPSSSFGFTLRSANIVITSCNISGIAKH